MKKMLFTLLISCSFLAAFSHDPDSQIPVDIVHARALKDFAFRFCDVSQVSWYATKDGYITYFKQDGFGNRAFYNNKGRWMFSLVFYGEDKLPSELRASVKSVYYDWNIVVVEEVHSNNGMVYLIHLEDKSRIRILKANGDGEWELKDEFYRS